MAVFNFLIGHNEGLVRILGKQPGIVSLLEVQITETAHKWMYSTGEINVCKQKLSMFEEFICKEEWKRDSPRNVLAMMDKAGRCIKCK